MKIKITSGALANALKAVKSGVGKKGSVAALTCVHVVAKKGGMDTDSVVLTTTNLDYTYRTSVTCEVEEEGEVLLPCEQFLSIAAKLPGGVCEVKVDQVKNSATIKCGSSTFRLNGLPASEFPKLPANDGERVYTLKCADIRSQLRMVAYAASTDDTRRTLKGVLMHFTNGTLRCVATDGRRLAVCDYAAEGAGDGDMELILPSTIANDLIRILPTDGDSTVRISMAKTQASILMKDIEIYCKLIDDTYPNYKQVVPASTANCVTVDRQMLLDALDRVSVMTMDEAHSVRLVFSPGKLTVLSAESDNGRACDEVPIKYSGESIEIVFNPHYVMDPLKVISDDEVTINLNNGHSPAVIKCSVKFLYVLMPLRIN